MGKILRGGDIGPGERGPGVVVTRKELVAADETSAVIERVRDEHELRSQKTMYFFKDTDARGTKGLDELKKRLREILDKHEPLPPLRIVDIKEPTDTAEKISELEGVVIIRVVLSDHLNELTVLQDFLWSDGQPDMKPLAVIFTDAIDVSGLKAWYKDLLKEQKLVIT